jgi:hypothetical protein
MNGDPRAAHVAAAGGGRSDPVGRRRARTDLARRTILVGDIGGRIDIAEGAPPTTEES